MKQWFIAAAVAAAYLLFSVFTGLWAISWIIWIFYGIYRIADYIKSQQ